MLLGTNPVSLANLKPAWNSQTASEAGKRSAARRAMIRATRVLSPTQPEPEPAQPHTVENGHIRRLDRIIANTDSARSLERLARARLLMVQQQRKAMASTEPQPKPCPAQPKVTFLLP